MAGHIAAATHMTAWGAGISCLIYLGFLAHMLLSDRHGRR
jgi:hypothetical protein